MSQPNYSPTITSRGTCSDCGDRAFDLRDGRCRECDLASFAADGGDVDECLGCGIEERVRNYLDCSDGLCDDCDADAQREERREHDRREYLSMI